jgi:hypothetical protein
MFRDFVQTIIPRQQSMKKVHQHFVKQPSQIFRTAMADIQSDGDDTTSQNNPPQLRAVLSLIQM